MRTFANIKPYRILILFVVSCRCEAGGWNEGVGEWGAEEVTGDWRKLQDDVL
jgi:hypothetical protein